jgi:ribosome maturation factor RimP
MKKVSKEFFLEELTTPVVESLGYELTDLTFEKQGKDWCLTLFIDSETGISLDDCEIVSRQIGEFCQILIRKLRSIFSHRWMGKRILKGY